MDWAAAAIRSFVGDDVAEILAESLGSGQVNCVQRSQFERKQRAGQVQDPIVDADQIDSVKDPAAGTIDRN